MHGLNTDKEKRPNENLEVPHSVVISDKDERL
jgi:hypothetical protein